MLARRHFGGALHRVELQAHPVVGVVEVAIEHIEAPSPEVTALREDHAAGLGGYLHLGGELQRGVLHVDEGVLRHALGTGIEHELGATVHQVGSSGDHRVEALNGTVVDRQHIVLHGLLHEFLLQLLQLGGLLGGKVVGLAEVLVHIVELPHVLGERAAWCGLPGGLVDGAGEPAVVVDGTVADHLEVLGLAGVGGFSIGERIVHGHALDGALLDAVHHARRGHARCCEHRGCHVHHMVELRPHLSLGGDAGGPVHHHAVAGTAEVAGHLFGPGEGRISGHGPTRREVVVGVLGAQLVDPAQLHVQRFLHAVEVGVLVVHTDHTTFRAGTIVAHDVENERVVQFAARFQRIDQAAHLCIGVFGEAGEHLHLPLEEALLIGAELVPILDIGGLGGEHGVGGNNAQGLLPGQGLLAHLVPALCEFPLVLVAVLLGSVMRRVRGTGGEVHHERLVRREALLGVHPRQGLIRHVVGEVVARGLNIGVHTGHAIIYHGMPLVGLPADEAIELVEATAGGPAVEGSGNGTLPGRCLVVLAERTGAVTVEAQHFGHGGDALRTNAGVTGKGRGHLHDGAGIVAVVVVAGENGRACGRAQRGGVEAVVLQSVRRQLLERWHVDGAAEGAAVPEADVVDQYHQHVGGTLRRVHLEAGRRGGVARVQFGDGRGTRLTDGQHGAVVAIGDGGFGRFFNGVFLRGAAGSKQQHTQQVWCVTDTLLGGHGSWLWQRKYRSPEYK